MSSASLHHGSSFVMYNNPSSSAAILTASPPIISHLSSSPSFLLNKPSPSSFHKRSESVSLSEISNAIPTFNSSKTEEYTSNNFYQIDYYDSLSIDLPFCIKLDNIQFFSNHILEQEYNIHQLDDCLIEISLVDTLNQTTLCPVQLLPYSHISSQDAQDWIFFGISYKELTTDCYIFINVWTIYSPTQQLCIGGVVLPIFGSKGKLKSGKYDISIFTLQMAQFPQTLLKIKSNQHSHHSLQRSMNCYFAKNEKPIEWLDQYTCKQVKSISQQFFLQRKNNSTCCSMTIQFQTFDLPVFSLSLPTRVQQQQQQQPSQEQQLFTNTQQISVLFNPNYVSIEDVECNQMNLVEDKNLKLTVSLSDPLVDCHLLPNAEETKQIQSILDYPPLRDIKMEEKQLLWKFRYYLSNNKRALIRFLKCIDWQYSKEESEAIHLLQEEWAEIDTTDALFLLSRTFQHVPQVRSYAVKILIKKADDETLLDILLQLVQALRYEKNINNELSIFLIDRACNRFEIANQFNWYLQVEAQDKKCGEMFRSVHHEFWIQLRKKNAEHILEKLVKQEKLVKTLLLLAKKIKQDKESRMKKIVKLRNYLVCKGEPFDWPGVFVSQVSKQFDPSPVTLPICPHLYVNGFVAEEATIFKSAMYPFLLPFKIDVPYSQQQQLQEHSPPITHDRYNVIFKNGDDLRQDQLIIQLVTLMDKLLKRNGLDLQLTPYRVLATGMDNGFVECISPNIPISKVKSGDIRGWLKKQNTAEMDYQLALNNFVKSCAGYCVITYILGIGDRHLDNILLTPQGKLFHIDFGFILGRDPKPFPPPMKLSKEMVEGMGGTKSEGYFKFIDLCCTAYNILRKYAFLIIYMFVLMIDANIHDIQFGVVDPLKNVSKVQEKFRIELTDAQAIEFMKSIINESEKALFPQITERVHRWAQYFRN